MNMRKLYISVFILFIATSLFSQDIKTKSDTIKNKPVLLVIECNRSLYLNYLHEDWKRQLKFDNNEMQNTVYNDVLDIVIDSLETRFEVAKAGDFTYASYSFKDEIKASAGYFMDVVKEYDSYKEDEKNNYKESKIAKSNNRQKYSIDKKLVRNDIDKFLNVRFSRNNFYDELRKQKFDYVLFITQIFIEKDRTGKYKNYDIIKVDYSFISNRGKYLYGNRETQMLIRKNKKYKYYKMNILPLVGGNISRKIKFNEE